MTNLVPQTSPGRASELVAATERDRYFDYCLEPYRPRRPWRGMARSESLLWNALREGAATDSLQAPLRAIQQHLGNDLTVWGTKWDGARLWWELYFYDPRKEAPEATLSSLRDAMAPFVNVVPRVSESVPYMMVSFDLSPASMATREIREVNVYLTGERAHAGRSYAVRADRVELENTYRFLEPKRNIDELLPLLMSSMFVDYSDGRVLSRVLIPELFACKKICVAKKRTSDAIYYSGITVEQLRWFLARFQYPAGVRAFVDRNAASFEHLYFDVGIDYRQVAGGRIEYPKTSYYGTL